MKTALMLILTLFATLAMTAEFDGYVVKLKPGKIENFMSEKGHGLVGTFSPLKTSFGDYVVFRPAMGVSASKIEEIKNHPDVNYIEPNHIFSIKPTMAENKSDTSALNDDPNYSKQWGLKNTGTNSGGWFSTGKVGEDINAEKAWEITRGSSEVKVAVIDTGVDYRHPDLKANIWTNEAELNGKEGVDDDGNGYVDDIHGYDFSNNDGDPYDDNGHGTHCAGVIGAKHDNGIGVAGVMSNVKIVAIKFLAGNGNGTSEQAALAVDYAIKAGVQVMSNSWGGDEDDQILRDAIQAANEKGIIFVAAAGNENNNNDRSPTFPAAYTYENMLTVGSYAGNGARSSFSNYGSKTVHVFAPGSNIYSTYPGSSYRSLSGTSMATPFVAGMMGLLYAHDSNIEHREAIKRVIETSTKTSALSNLSSSNGRANAYNLLMDIRK